MRRFWKKNRVLSICCFIAVLICLAYVLSFNDEKEVGQIYKWFNLLFQVSVGFIINFIFFVTQIYIPQSKHDREANKCVGIRIDGIVRHMRDIFSQLGIKYMGEYDENKLTSEYCLAILRSIKIDDEVRVLNPTRLYSTAPSAKSYYTVKQWIENKIMSVEKEADMLMSYYAPYITAELMKTIDSILYSPMHQNMVRSLLQIPAGITFSDSNDDIFLKPYFDLMKALEKMSVQYKN